MGRPKRQTPGATVPGPPRGETPREQVRAVGLLSGGLDSTLAARLLQEQGVEVLGLHFATGFCKVDHRRALRRPRDQKNPKRLRHEALRAGADAGVPVEIIDVSEEYFREVVLNPKHGYGSAMNPCIDCRIFMLKKAKEIADAQGAEIVFTGEVLGQRPMSQYRRALELIEKEAGLEGRLLRPLSARHLPPTRAEHDGRVAREHLLAIEGRSRREQLALAQRFGMFDIPTPSGGCCFLADENFARRLRDLLSHSDPQTVTTEDVRLLKVGRHFRLAHDLKVVLGRDEAESRFLAGQAAGRWTCQVADGHGAFGIVEGVPNGEQREAVASLAARYSRHRNEMRVEVILGGPDGSTTRLEVAPARDEWAHSLLL